MASSTKKMPLCYVLLLILGVMGDEDIKKPGELAENVRRGSEKLAASLRDRSQGTKPSEGMDGGPSSEGVIEGSKAGWEGLRGVKTGDGGEITRKIESGENWYTARVGNEQGERRKQCGGEEPSAGRRKRDDIPQTRNPTETNGRGREGMDLSEEITRGGVASREAMEELGERATEMGPKRRKSLSTNEPNTPAGEDEGERLEEELKEAEREMREEGREREDLEEELAMQREEKLEKEFRSSKEEESVKESGEGECGHPPCREKEVEMEQDESHGVEEIAAESGEHIGMERNENDGRSTEEKNNIQVNGEVKTDVPEEKYEEDMESVERTNKQSEAGDAGGGVGALKLEEGEERRKASTSGNFSMRGNVRSDGSVSNKERGFPVPREGAPSENSAGNEELHYENDEEHRRGGQRKRDGVIRGRTDADEEKEIKMREDELEAELKRTETSEKKIEDGIHEGRDMKELRNSGISGEKVPGDSIEKDTVRDQREREEMGENKGDADEENATGEVTGVPDSEAPEVNSETRKGSGEHEDTNYLRLKDQIESAGYLKQSVESGGNVGLDIPFVKEPEAESGTGGTVDTPGPCSGPSSSLVVPYTTRDGTLCSERVSKRHSESANGQKEGVTANEAATLVVEGEREIESPRLMEKKSQRRLKGDDGEVWEGKQWDPGERDRGPPVKWATTEAMARDSHLSRTGKDIEKGKARVEYEARWRVLKDTDLERPHKDPKDITTDENNKSIYEKEIESLKSSKEEEDDLTREDPNGDEKGLRRDEGRRRSEFPNGMSGSTLKERKTDFDGRSFAEGGAPVVIAGGEGKETNPERGYGLGDGGRDETHQGALPSPKTIPNSMLHRILEVKANLNSRAEPDNLNDLNEATKQLTPGSRIAEWQEPSREAMEESRKEVEKFDLEKGGIKGPRRMLMSVPQESETTKDTTDRRETEEPGPTTHSGYGPPKSVEGNIKASKWNGLAIHRGRNLVQSAWKGGKGVKFVARREVNMHDKGVHVPHGSLIQALKYSGNASLSTGKLDVAKKRARSKGVVIGDKIYRVGKYGLVAVSMVDTPTIPTKRHHQISPSGDITKAIDSVTYAGTDSMTPKTVRIEDKLKAERDQKNSKAKGAWKSRLGKKSPTSSTESGFSTTVTREEQVTLESPPTLSIGELNTDSGLVLGNHTAQQGTTVATPAEKELGIPDWKMAPLSDSSFPPIPVGCEGGKGDCIQKVGHKEESLGYTRLQIRKPRMLDASGFGRGRGTHLGSSIVSSSGSGKRSTLTVGMILPYTAFGQRDYTKATNNAIAGLSKSKTRKLEFIKKYAFTPQQVRPVMMQLTPSPTAILNSLCKEFLSVNVSAILYLMNYEKYGRSTASAQYFLQLAGYLGIPVIAWNADNSGLERRASQSSLQLQLAPSLEHQTAAMLSILERYKWHQFSIVTSQIAGHDDFVQAIRERILEMQDVFKFTILNAVLVTKPSDLSELVNSESRVVLLYCTKEEALKILKAAADYQITGENYVWVVAQSVIENKTPYPQFPIGMLGVHFDTGMPSLVQEISTAIKVYAYGVEDFINDPRNEKLSLNTQLSCEGAGDSRWKVGDRFFKYLRNVSVETEHGKPNIEFTPDGVLKAAELKILNLRPAVSRQLKWEEIGVWKSWEREGLDIKDIVWPGGSHTPPQGVPEKFHMRITFLEEPPYINVAPPDPITGKCSINRGVLCRFAAETDMSGMDVNQAHRNASYYQCCSGFCIDLLEKFSEELGFTYELVRVEDGKWGTLENGKWNGLIADLINRKTDMVMTSLMINSDREAVVDFTVPFMESGIAIVVAKRTGIISPTAFLEPFDSASWMLVGLVAIQVSAFTIFLFEWLSPSGFNMKVAPSTNHRFSLFRTYWLVWAVLFQAAVHVDCPKGFTARFMTNVWAMFAVVFLAIYTANLAAFMITREEFHEFSGIDDHRLAKPFSHKPMFKFGTIPWGHTDSTLKKYFREMHAYMKRHNRTVVGEGIEAVLSGELDAFIYDGTVLDYLVSQDEDCRLLTVGSWYAMTGYGIAFQRNSKYVRMFNQRLLDFRENGDLERLRRYWMTGSCKPGKQERKSSDPLALEQFLSAFLLLMSGILLAAFLLLLEHLYFKYVRHHLARTDRGGCCALVSLSMGKSLTFRGAVYEAQDVYRNNRRGGPLQHQHSGGHRAFSGIGRNCNCSYCEGLHTLWATRRELEACRLRIRHLEKQMEAHGIRPLPPPPPQSLPSLLPPPGSPGNRRFLNDEDALRTRDMTRNHVTSTEYCGQLYRPCRTEIAEMETVL